MRTFRNLGSAWLIMAVLHGAGCTGVGVDPLGMEIVEDVSPVKPVEIHKLCIKVNTSVKQAFTDGLFETIRSLGIQAQSMQTAFTGECPYWVGYDASWEGFPNYLVMARVEVFKGSTRLGYALYDASSAGGRPDRFGSAVGKVRPLVEGLLHHVKRESASEG